MHTLLWLVLLLGVGTVRGQDEPGLTLEHLAGPLYVVQDGFYAPENSMVYVGEQGVTVIGATWTPETARLLHEEIRRITDKPVHDVVLVNHHPDRAGGNAYWKSIRANIKSTELTYWEMRRKWEGVLGWMRHHVPDYPDLLPVLPETTFPGDFTCQNGRIRVFHLGPSHTQDGMFVWFPEEKVLYGGCILKEQLGNLDFADVEAYPVTLEKLKALKLDIRTIVAGHYSPLHGPELIDEVLHLLETRGSAAPLAE